MAFHGPGRGRGGRKASAGNLQSVHDISLILSLKPVEASRMAQTRSSPRHARAIHSLDFVPATIFSVFLAVLAMASLFTGQPHPAIEGPFPYPTAALKSVPRARPAVGLP